MFMGTGNLTELTDCDSSGANAIMMGMVSELSIDAVLVVQVSGHCKNSIKETDAARKIMHFSKKNQRLPFRVSNDLLCISERKPKRKSKDEVEEIKSMVKDSNYRIILSDEGINIFNKEISAKGKTPYDFYDKIDVMGDTSHAFYLGVELARAQIAYQLGKNYDQDNQLKWGIAVEEEKVDLMNRPELKTTQKKR
jgi:dihydropteroate synthase